jgi:hypothetical protein
VRIAAFFALATVLFACTETPSYFPPCVDPYTPCMSGEGGTDASDGGAADAAPPTPPSEAEAAAEAAAADAP